MILSLSIHNLVFIDKLEIDFKNGLNVFTGETGAGKSIIMTSISLALGAKSNPGIVKNNEDKATITLEISANNQIKSLCEECDIDVEDCIYLKRVQFKDGRTKSYIDDNPVSLSIIKKISSYLVESHGQNEDLSFIDQSNHIDIIDTFGDYADKLFELKLLSSNIKLLQKEIQEKEFKLKQANNKIAIIQDMCNEILGMKISNGEEEILSEKRKLLLDKVKLISALDNIHMYMNSENGLEELLSKLYREISVFQSNHPNYYTSFAEELDGVSSLLDNFKSKVGSMNSELSLEDDNLEQIEKRLFEIKAMRRKYDIQTDNINDFYHSSLQELNLLKSGESDIKQMTIEYDSLLEDYNEISKKLSIERRRIAKVFDKNLLSELQDLKFPNVTIKTNVLSKSQIDDFGPKGQDIVNICISTSKEKQPEVINKVASGGETSRIILAIKSIMSQEHQNETLIFDEIDSGVSGATAMAIGKKLFNLSKKMQIFTVTHSPQVASKANHHFVIKKNNNHNSDYSIEIKQLDKDERIEEVARMLSGEKITNQAREASKSLIYEEYDGSN
jgi:DNA repair protein RecN (Recombination protein N)